MPKQQFSFQASLDRFSIDRDGQAKVTLAIPKSEVKQMAELGLHDNKLLQVAVVIIPKEDDGD